VDVLDRAERYRGLAEECRDVAAVCSSDRQMRNRYPRIESVELAGWSWERWCTASSRFGLSDTVTSKLGLTIFHFEEPSGWALRACRIPLGRNPGPPSLPSARPWGPLLTIPCPD
jgi:hypothetical protein